MRTSVLVAAALVLHIASVFFGFSTSGRLSALFVLAFLFFPLLYGWAELTLFSDHRAARH